MNFYNTIPSNVGEVNRTNIVGYNELSSLIINRAENQMWGKTKSRAGFAAFMNQMGTGSTNQRKIITAIGDRPTLQLTGTADVTLNGSTYTFTVANVPNSIQIGQIMSATITGSTTAGRLMKVISVDQSNNRINAVIIDGGSISLTSQTDFVLNLFANSLQLDGRAPSSIDFTNDVLENYIQRSRYAVSAGKWNTQGEFYGDQSIDHKASLLLESTIEMMDRSLLLQAHGALPTSTYDGGYAKGVSGFLKNQTALGSLSGYYGANEVIYGTSLTYKNLRDWFRVLGRYTSTGEKIVAITPDMFGIIEDLVETKTTIFRNENYQFTNSMNQWNMPMIEIGGQKVWFVVDESLNGVSMANNRNMSLFGRAANGSNDVSSFNNNYMFAIDPDHFELVYYNVDGSVQSPALREVPGILNDTTETKEVSVGWTLACYESRGSGCLSITG